MTLDAEYFREAMLCLRSGGRAAAARCRLSTSAAGERLALRSTSRDIFVNLAVEDWLYQHHNLGQRCGQRVDPACWEIS